MILKFKTRYKIIDLLGSGTFGQVVKCENLSTHELVSVKIIKNKLAFRQQSNMEAEILQRVKEKKEQFISTCHYKSQ